MTMAKLKSLSLTQHLKMDTVTKICEEQRHFSSERTQLLDAIGFVWNPSEHEWQKNYQQLLQYRQMVTVMSPEEIQLLATG